MIVCNNKQASEEFPSGACVFFRGCRSFLTKKMGGGSAFLPGAIARAGSRREPMPGSVWMPNPCTKRNRNLPYLQNWGSVCIICRTGVSHSSGAAWAKPFRRANRFRPHNLSSKGCSNEPTCQLCATPSPKMSSRGEQPHGPGIGSCEGTGPCHSLQQANRTSAHFFARKDSNLKLCPICAEAVCTKLI